MNLSLVQVYLELLLAVHVQHLQVAGMGRVLCVSV
jgi:hypothetical protein